MSLDQQKIEAFIELIKSQSSLFSSQDQADLWKLVPTLPNNVEEIANAIADWSHPRNHVWNALARLLGQSSGGVTRGPAKNPAPINPKDYQETLVNAMRQSFPTSEPQPPSSQPKPSDSQP